MSIQLSEEQVEFLHNTIEAARDLLDNVHCYETEEFDDLGVALKVLDGNSPSDARDLYQEERNG